METSIYQVDHIITIQDPLELASILNMNCSQFANVICRRFRSLYGVTRMTTKDFQSRFCGSSIYPEEPPRVRADCTLANKNGLTCSEDK